MDCVANETGCTAMIVNFRRCGGLRVTSRCRAGLLGNAISHVLSLHEPTGVILVGTSPGGSIAICVAADDPRMPGR